MEYKYFDVHSHVSFPEFEKDRDEVLLRMEKAGVGTITVGVDLATSKAAVEFAEEKDYLYATIGVHPADNRREVFNPKEYESLVTHEKTVAIGECGLDYFRIKGDEEADKKRQKEIFEAQIDFATTHNKAMMLHSRPSKGTLDAYEDVIDMLRSKKRESGDRLRGNAHFYVGDVAMAKRFYAIDFTTSFTGVLTFASEYDDVVREAPLSMILSETDSPFAAPTPFRGKRNEPTYVGEIVKAIARIRKDDEEKVAKSLVNNACRVFDIAG